MRNRQYEKVEIKARKWEIKMIIYKIGIWINKWVKLLIIETKWNKRLITLIQGSTNKPISKVRNDLAS